MGEEGGKLGARGVEWRAWELIEDVEADFECRESMGFPFKFDVELPAEMDDGGGGGIAGARGLEDSSCPTHQSHNTQPRIVATLPQPTTASGAMRLWKMPTKQTMKMMTEQTCWTMTVESATKGQKSYGWRRGFRWRCSRKVA